jgi:hypothetical protein
LVAALTRRVASARRVAEQHATTSGWAAFTAAAFLAFGHAGLVAGLALWAVHLHWRPSPEVVAVWAGLVLVLAGLAWLVAGVPDPPDVYVVTRRDVPSLLAVVGSVALVVAAWRSVPGGRVEVDLDQSVLGAGDLPRYLAAPVRRDGPAAPALLEAVAIVVVVGASTLPSGDAPLRLVDRWLGDATWFAVPALVFAAGLRASRHTLPRGWTRRRLEGLLAPYLLISVLAIALGAWSDVFPPVANPVTDLLLGATFPEYHLVLTLVLLTLVSPALVRLRGTAGVLVLAVAVIAQAVVRLWPAPEAWQLRNPLLWLAFYHAGVLVWRHRDRLDRWSGAWPGVLLAWSLALVVVLVLPSPAPARDLATLVAAWLMVAALWLLGRSTTVLPRAAWGLSRSAYLVYLAHVPFVLVVTGADGTPAPSLRTIAGWTIGLIGALSVIVIGRHVRGGGVRGVRGE